MPIFDVRYADGSTVSVEAPAGASQSQIAQLANQRRMATAQTFQRAPEQDVTAEAEARLERLRALRERNRRKNAGFLENALSGFGAGAVGVGELAALGGAALLDEETELRTRDAIKEAAEALRPESGDPESIAYKLFSGLGSIAGFAVPAALAATAAPAAAATAVGLGTAGALGMGAGAGEARERARAAGLTGEELTAPTAKGTLIGALELAPVAKPLAVLGRALKIKGLDEVGERLATKIDAETVAGRLGQRVRSAGVTGVAEGAQEASAAILQNLVEQGYNPEKELVDAGVVEEGAIGAGAGALLQALADVLVKGRTVRAPEPVSEKPKAEEAVLPAGVAPAVGAAPEQEATPERTPEEQAAIDAAVAEVTGGPTEEEIAARLRASALDEEAQAEAEAAQAEVEAQAEEAAGQGLAAIAQRFEAADRAAKAMEAVEAAPAEEPTPEAPVQATMAEDTEEAVDESTAAVSEPVGEPAGVVEGVEPAGAGVSPADGGPEPAVGRGGRKRGPRAKPAKGAVVPEAPVMGAVEGDGLPTAEPVAGAGAQPSTLETDTDRLNRITDVAPETLNAEEQAVRAYLTRRPKDQKLTEERINALGIPKAAPVAKKIKGKSIADEGARAALQEYAANPDVAPKTQRAIQQLLRAQIPGTAAAPDLAMSLNTLAYDLVYRESDSPLIGTGGRTGSGVRADTVAPADAALKWVRENGSPELNATMDAEIDGAVQALELQYKNLRKREAREAPGMVTGRGAKPKGEIRNELLTALEADTIDVKEVKRLAKSLPAADSVGMLRANADVFADTEAEAALNKFAEEEQQRAEQEKLAEGAIGKVSDRVVTARRLAKELKKREPNRETVLKEVEALRTMKSLNVALDSPLTTDVETAINKGDLTGALSAFGASTPSKVLGRIATKLGEVISNTKLVVVDDLRDAEGREIAGQFDPNTNTITLDANRGVNGHTLMHEATHAAVSATLANPNHPLTRRLNTLFNNVRGIIDNFYGATSLDEFASDALSNEEFRRKLATLTLEGKPISALTRFNNAVVNFLRGLIGLPSKTPTSALDETDKLLNDMLAPAPEARDAGVLYSAAAENASAAILNRALKDKPPFDSEARRKVQEVLDSRVAQGAKVAVLKFLPLNNLIEFSRPYLKSAEGLLDIIRRQSGTISRTNDRIRNTITPVAKWAKGHQKEYAILSKLLPHSSLAEIDPSKPRNEYRFMKDGETGEDMQKGLDEYDQLREWYDSLGEEGQRHYRSLRNMFRQLYRDGWKVLTKRLEKIEDPEVRDRLSKNLWERIYSNGIIDPYFPLIRKGKYWVSYNDIDPISGNVEFFTFPVDTKADRTRLMEELARTLPERLRNTDMGRRQIAAQMSLTDDQGQPRYATEEEAIAAIVDLQQAQRVEDIDFRRAPPTSFVNEVVQTLEGNNVDQTTINAVMQLYLNSLPEKSLLQSFRTRKGVRGFAGDVALEGLVPKADILDAYADKARALNRQLISIEYGAELTDYRDRMLQEVKEKERRGEDVETAQAFRQVLNGMSEFAAAPNIATWSKVATSIGFGMTLGLNVSSAMLNLMQLPMIVAPYLSGRYGMKDTFKALTEAFTIFRNSARPHEVEYFSDTQEGELIGQRRVEGKTYTAFHPSLDNYDFDNPNNTLARDLNMSPEGVEELRVLRNVMGELGNLHRSITEDVLDMDSFTGSGTEKALQAVNSISGWMFHHTEKINRQVTAIAAYRLAVAKAKKDGKEMTPELLEQLAREAVNDTELTNGSAASAAAPAWAQSSLGKVLFLFKRFGLAMYGLMGQLTRDSFRDADPETRAIAQRQLAGIFGGAALFSGAQGMPMFGMMAMVHDLFAPEDEDDFETQVRKYLGEGAYGGIGNYALGIDLGSRVGLSDLVFRSNPMAKEQDPLYDLVEMALGPVGGVYFSMRRGASQIAEGDLERGIEAMMPAAFRNTLKSVRLYNEGATTLRGDPIIDDIGPYSAAFQFFGFAPAEYIRQLEQNANLKRIDKAVSSERSRILKQIYRARREGDVGRMRSTIQALGEFNRRNPQAAITPDTIERSMRAHLRTSQRMHHGVTFSPKNDAFLRRNAAEYDDDITIWD
jgi:hypothetical protein